jgi:hypothetical protein
MKFTRKAVGTVTPESAENLNRYVASVPRDCGKATDEACDYCSRYVTRPVIVRMPNGTTCKVNPSGTAKLIFLMRSD